MTETQERFLRTVLTRVPLDAVVELHLFPSLRRGTVETGVAVIASQLPVAQLSVVGDTAVDDAEFATADSLPETDVDDSPYSDMASDAARVDVSVAGALPRLRILTASYRLTIKGVERGAWVVDVQDEADAPLEAVEAVLRGVRHRSTEPADPELISHHALASLLVPSAIAPAA